jgi:fatty-acyl-CoA synthase
MERFDAQQCLDLISSLRVTHAQFVPTMFVRMLRLPEADRRAFDSSSLQYVVHAAAPCSVSVKRAMIDWWGPIIHEYYAGTEGIGLTYVGPEDWLAHPGTVGRPFLGTIHICDEAGDELGVNEDGIIYFERERQVFEYHNAPEKTRSAHHPVHETWAALGDVGHVDDDGFLYLCGRTADVVVSAGVNVYPAEIEQALSEVPGIADMCAVGAPDAERGEVIALYVSLLAGADRDTVLADIDRVAIERLAPYKRPRSVTVIDEIPRDQTGKLLRRVLRDPLWA